MSDRPQGKVRAKSSVPLLPGRRFLEPAFAEATIKFADEIVDELVRAADMARPSWEAIASENAALFANLVNPDFYQGQNLLNDRAIATFVREWANAIQWPTKATYHDGIQLELPRSLIERLQECSGVTDVEFYLASLGDYSFARLGSNDEDCLYGLYLHVPAIAPLAANPLWREAFVYLLRMIVHHEMGHFKWKGPSDRAEHIAHARGISALSFAELPAESIALIKHLQTFHPEVLRHPEIRTLIGETRGGAKLARAWSERRRRIYSRQAEIKPN